MLGTMVCYKLKEASEVDCPLTISHWSNWSPRQYMICQSSCSFGVPLLHIIKVPVGKNLPVEITVQNLLNLYTFSKPLSLLFSDYTLAIFDLSLYISIHTFCILAMYQLGYLT